MEKEIKQEIFKALDRFRGRHPIRDTKLIELIVKTQGTDRLNNMLADEKLLKMLTNHYSFVAPTYILNFIYDIANNIRPKNHFDPRLTASSPLVHRKFEGAVGICQNQQDNELIRAIFLENPVQIIFGDPLIKIDEIKDNFDLITCFPPFGMRKERAEINRQVITEDYGTLILLKSASLLTEKGLGVYLMPNSFLFNQKTKDTVRSFGLSIDAVFAIPSGTFLPQTAMPANLIVISKQPKESTFVAEITQDERNQKTILENYAKRRDGKLLQLGAFVNIDQFTSFQALVSEREMQEMVKRMGFEPVRLSEIALEINALKTDNPDEVNHLPNTVYLPRVGNSPAVATPSTMKIKPKNYFQISLDSEKANASFVANYFNSPIGRKLRESLEVGAVIPSISKTSLSNCVLHLPDLNTQAELVELDSRIEQFSIRLDELKRSLWKQPKNRKVIAKELRSINQEGKLEHWIDTLPFPVSSILWRYYTTKDNSKKVEHLFHFFEGFSEFLSMIMLSAYVQDKEFYKHECQKWIDTDEKFKDWYLRANFGSWNVLTSRLSKATRQYLSDKDMKDMKEQCKNLYGQPSDEFLEMLTNKGIVNVLLEVADLRNKWKGHGGITSEEECKQRAAILEQKLNEIRKFIGDGFEETKMLSPTTSTYEDGIFYFNAKELVGARTPFNEISIQSLIPLDKKKLYLAHSNQSKPVELLPFIKYLESSDACYFYMSIESKGVRWVSYHFDKDPEITQPADNDLLNAFEFLKPQG